MDTVDMESIKLEIAELKHKCEQLQAENSELKAKVCISEH